MKRQVFLLLAAAPLLGGCVSDTAFRYDGVSASAGNAIAANTVMQMVDPWPAGVEQTDLKIPADQDQYRKAAPAAESDDGATRVAAD